MLRKPNQSAFTLIELIAVLVIIAITLAIAAPSLRGWSENGKLRNCSDQFLSATRWARRQAISTARDQVLCINASSTGFVVNSDDTVTQTSADGEYGRQNVLPTGFEIRMVSGGENPSSIRFLPNGRVTPAVIEIRSSGKATLQIVCTDIAGTFKVVQTDQ